MEIVERDGAWMLVDCGGTFWTDMAGPFESEQDARDFYMRMDYQYETE